jgi:hypothetical protein
VALIQEGRILEIDRPAEIGRHYPLPLLAVRTAERYRALLALRRLPHAASVFPFGDTIHYSDARAAMGGAEIAAELRAALLAEGIADAEVAPIAAGIEDSFMALMGGAEAVA